jgi:hypothetical protein
MSPINGAMKRIVVLLLGLVVLVTAAPVTVAAYRPAFVTQTDSPPPWSDCLWAAGAMLIDAWSGGIVTVSRSTLRTASGDKRGGSTLQDLERAVVRRFDVSMRWSPFGGATTTIQRLAKVLQAGGSAVVIGDYGQLPRWYTRWDRRFAASQEPIHALFVTGVDRRSVWIMDPLGRGVYAGERLSFGALDRFALKTRTGRLFAVTTEDLPPFADLVAITPTLSTDETIAGTPLEVSVAVPSIVTGRDLRLELSIEDATDPTVVVDPQSGNILDPTTDTESNIDIPLPLPADEVASDLPEPTETPQPRDRQTVPVTGPTVTIEVIAPTRPGSYQVRTTLFDEDGRQISTGTTPLAVAPLVVHPLITTE